jgi:hypothetical protein
VFNYTAKLLQPRTPLAEIRFFVRAWCAGKSAPLTPSGKPTPGFDRRQPPEHNTISVFVGEFELYREITITYSISTISVYANNGLHR